jgi:hypothetical protein
MSNTVQESLSEHDSALDKVKARLLPHTQAVFLGPLSFRTANPGYHG